MISGVSTQDASASFAAFSMIRINVATAPAPQTASVPLVPPASDRVTLSPLALNRSPGETVATPGAGAGAAAGAPVGAADPETSADAGRPRSAGAPRIAALLEALDAGHDGTLTKDEFVQGASALLRRAGGRHRDSERHDGVEGGPAPRHGRTDRLDRRLTRAFGRIDADGSGALDVNELTAAVSRSRTRSVAGDPPPSAGPAPAPAGPTATGTFAVTTVTFVAVAVRQYEAVSQLRG